MSQCSQCLYSNYNKNGPQDLIAAKDKNNSYSKVYTFIAPDKVFFFQAKCNATFFISPQTDMYVLNY